MKVPTQEQFDEWLLLTSTRLDIGDIFSPIQSSLEENAVKTLLVESDKLYELRLAEIQATYLHQWLVRTKEVERARSLVFRSVNRKRKVADVASQLDLESMAKSLIAEVKAETASWSVNQPQFALKNALATQYDILSAAPFSGTWLKSCVLALKEYFGDSTARRLVEVQRAYGKALNAAQEAMQTYLAIKREAEAIGLVKLGGITRRNRLLGKLDTLEHFALIDADWPPKDPPPVTRIDEHSNERLFVFRMFKANQRAVRKPRIEAIAELMGIDGFRHQYNNRTIERLCTDFTDKKCGLFSTPLPGR